MSEIILRAPPAPVLFSGNPIADDLLNDLSQHPHAFVLACVMDRQIKAELAWLIPHHFAEKLGNFEFSTLRALSLDDVRSLITKPRPLHRFCQRRRECASAGRSKNASLTMRGATVLRDAGFSGVTAN